MTENQIKNACDKIAEQSDKNTIGDYVVVGRVAVHAFKITNIAIENLSHYHCVIDSFDDAVGILSCLYKAEKTTQEIIEELKENSDYELNKPLYLHYIKSL